MKDHILIADDDPDVVSAIRYFLETENYLVSSASSVEEIESKLKNTSFHLLIMDLNYSQDTTSGREGLDFVTKAINMDEQLPIVVMTAWGSVETAVEAMQLGARDFIQKPWENDRLLAVVNNQILRQKAESRSRMLGQENKLLRGELNPQGEQLLAKSNSMLELMDQIDQVALSDANILLTGENGTGKSLLARHIHSLSARKNGALISVNMGSISESLFESEMFGHVIGAFTDARENRIGRFELAEDGSLFLDEIGNTPYNQQAKLLRVLEDGQFEKVGSTRTQKTNCRLISATNCHLDEAVRSGSFRTDLLYRINTVTLRVPALNERIEDIVPLADFFLRKFKAKYNKPSLFLGDQAREYLPRYNWPGNIRELSHLIERATILCKNSEITNVELGVKPDENSKIMVGIAGSKETYDDIEKAILVDRLAYFNGNGMDAAKSLGMSKSALYRRLEKHNI